MHISSSSGRCLNGLLLASLLFCLTAITTGCALLKKKKGDDLLPGADESILSIHRYYPTINSQVHKGIVTLQHVSGKPVYVDSSPLISSKDIDYMETYPVADGVGLKIYLTTRGGNLWSQTTSEHYGSYLALVIDGGFRSLIKVPKSSSTGAFQLPGPFSETEAERLRNFVRSYRLKQK